MLFLFLTLRAAVLGSVALNSSKFRSSVFLFELRNHRLKCDEPRSLRDVDLILSSDVYYLDPGQCLFS